MNTLRVLSAGRRGLVVDSFFRPLLTTPAAPPTSSSSTSGKMQKCLLSSQAVPAARLPCRVKVSGGKRYAWCACGHSKKQPFCDGAHRTLAPDIAPLRFTLETNKTVMLCACKQTKNPPYCDGSHFKVIFKDVAKFVKGAFK